MPMSQEQFERYTAEAYQDERRRRIAAEQGERQARSALRQLREAAWDHLHSTEPDASAERLTRAGEDADRVLGRT